MCHHVNDSDREQNHNHYKIKIIRRKNAQRSAEQKIKSNIHPCLSLPQAYIFGDDQYFCDQVTAEHEKEYNESCEIKKFVLALK